MNCNMLENATKIKKLKDPITGEVKTIQIFFPGKRLFVPMNEKNRWYAEIKKQVDAGTLTVEDAD
tara:strand:+ start:1195 stop:1389 length:195 start_codon:yes stop_codon:yes gene_type:complete